MSAAITVHHGDVVTQRPSATGCYQFEGDPPQDVTAIRWKPNGPGAELSVRLGDRRIWVSGGIDGARYRLLASDGRTFDVRVSSTRPIETAGEAPAAGSALAQAVKRP